MWELKVSITYYMNVGEILLSYFLDTINFHREETETIAWFNKKKHTQ